MASDVICPGCGGRYHETVDEDGFLDGVNGERVPDLRRRRFDPTRPCNGSMLKLKDKYENFRWSSFPNDPSVIGVNLACPQCDEPYTDLRGYVKFLDPPITPEDFQKAIREELAREPAACEFCGCTVTLNDLTYDPVMDRNICPECAEVWNSDVTHQNRRPSCKTTKNKSSEAKKAASKTSSKKSARGRKQKK